MEQHFNIESFFPSAEHVLENVYVYPWESDILIQQKSGYHYEIELKVSRSDFLADFKKEAKHHQLANPEKQRVTIPSERHLTWISEAEYSQYDYDLSPLISREYRGRVLVQTSSYIHIRLNVIPNRFYYICPHGLLTPKDMPWYAGLLWYKDGIVIQKKAAKLLHKRKMDFDHKFMQKYKYKYIDAMAKVNALQRVLDEFNDIYRNPNAIQGEIDF